MLGQNGEAAIDGRMLIGPDWCAADGGAVLDVRNPADQSLVGAVPDATPADAEKAVSAAEKAQAAWAAMLSGERSAILRRWADAVRAHREDLGRLLSTEQGKPLPEALIEADITASFIEWFAEEGRRAYGQVIPAFAPGKQLVVTVEPVGISVAITPWNFPLSMVARKVAPADGRVRKVSFTGSTAVGKILLGLSAQTVKKASMELGGNAPFVVFDDADMDRALTGFMASKFRNAGQVCISPNRLLVQDHIHDEFVDRLTEKVEALKVGPGLEAGTEIGPMISERAFDKATGLVADAVRDGAAVRTGGSRHALGGTFLEPTILTAVNPQMRIFREEVFGPVVPVTRFADEEEGIALANDTEAGLAAYVYTRDSDRVWRVSAALQSGMIGVNDGVISTPVAPFGGVKESGLGREGAQSGLREYLEEKYLCIGVQ